MAPSKSKNWLGSSKVPRQHLLSSDQAPGCLFWTVDDRGKWPLRAIAADGRSRVHRETGQLHGAGVGPTKGLSEKSLNRSLSSIHILQPHPKTGRGARSWPTHAITKLFPYGGSISFQPDTRQATPPTAIVISNPVSACTCTQRHDNSSRLYPQTARHDGPEGLELNVLLITMLIIDR